MTDKALEYLKGLSKSRSDAYYLHLANGGKEYEDEFDVIEALDFTIKVLEKQIPKKPRPYIAFDGLEREGCPSHKENVILYAGQRFCDACGQAIDWSKKDG